METSRGSQGVNVETGQDGRKVVKDRECQKLIEIFPSL